MIKYFDHSATTAVDKEVFEAMKPYFVEKFGNASSVYRLGKENKEAINIARMKVAEAINCKVNEVYFTSCGSESDNLAIKGIALVNSKRGNHIITSQIEHPAVINTCRSLEKQGYKVTYLRVNKEGFIDLDELEKSITPKTILISIMFANNEIGTIEPIKEIGKIAKNKNIYFHTDAVQAVGNIKIDVKELNIDLLSMSAHKFYGPKGVGALYVREGVKFNKIQDGGHQEKGKRAGTENIAGIVGIGEAIKIAYQNLDKYNNKLVELRDYFINKVKNNISNIKINGDMKQRLPGNINISFADIDGEELLLKLDEVGICVSTGSACSSGASDPSHVLIAIGLPTKLAYGSLRVTFGIDNTKEDVDFLVEHLIKIVNDMRKKVQ